MHGKLIFLGGAEHQPLANRGSEGRPLRVVVPYTDPVLATEALTAAAELARDVEAALILMAVHVLPFPTPLECQEGIRIRLENELATVARASRADVRVKLVFARDRGDAFLGLLPRHSLVLVGARKRWWKTREERLAKRLSAAGHSVAVIRVQ